MRVPLTFDYQNKGVKQAKTDIAALGKSFLKATIGITSTTVALQRLGTFLKDSTQAALADQKAQAILNRTLENSGFGSASEQVAAYIEKLQLAAGISDNELRPAFQTLFNSIGSVTKTQQVLNTAIATSLGTGKDLATVVAAFGKAASGSNTAILKLGTGIDKTKLSAASFDAALNLLNAKFGGTSAAALKTMAGKVARLREAVDQAKEAIGYGLIDAFDKLATVGSSDIDTLQQRIVGLGTATGNVFRNAAADFNLFAKTLSENPVWQTLQPLLEFAKKGFEVPWLKRLTRTPKAAASNSGVMDNYNYQQRMAAEKKAAWRAAKAERERKLAAAIAAAKERAAAALKRKQEELTKAANELNKQFDIERISLAAALGRQQDFDTQKRLQALMVINELQYSENNSLSEMQKLIDQINKLMEQLTATQKLATTQQNEWTTAVAATAATYQAMLEKANQVALLSLQQGMSAGVGTAAAAAGARYAGQGSLWFDSQVAAKAEQMLTNAVATASLAQGQAAGLSLTDSLSGARYAAQAAQSYAQSQSTPVVVNVAGTVISESDLQQAIIDAVNTGARSGTSFSQVFSRL